MSFQYGCIPSQLKYIRILKELIGNGGRMLVAVEYALKAKELNSFIRGLVKMNIEDQKIVKEKKSLPMVSLDKQKREEKSYYMENN